VREPFSSGAVELDDWLRRYAHQNQKANSAVTYVSCIDDVVVGYYAITVAAVSREEIPEALQRSAPSQIPCILIARLAVDSHHAGQGIGAGLLEDALRRSLQISESVGAMAVLIHAKDSDARAFYEHQVDCYPSPVDDLQLVIPMKHIAKVYAAETVAS
jgi:GNAT superfamily N-acetyltransferase